jgi:Salmonella virulence plasmid 65kDa B protein
MISLPKGGRALRGIGEKLSPDLHTGTGNFTVPVALPPGRNGFQPRLSLVYSTGTGNGPFGLGWSPSVPGVSRKTSKGVPLYAKLSPFWISRLANVCRRSGSGGGAAPVSYWL